MGTKQSQPKAKTIPAKVPAKPTSIKVPVKVKDGNKVKRKG